MKTVLITGANKGIGFETARQLGRKGFKVIITARDDKKGNEALDKLKKENIEAEFVNIDVSNYDSIQNAFAKVQGITDTLDVLINNAGVLIDQGISLPDVSKEIVHNTMNTNALGPLFVTQTFLPMLKKGSRVVMVSSSGGQVCKGVSNWASVYCMSKTMVNALTRHFARELKGIGISVNAVDPGWVSTEMGGSSAPRSIEKGAEIIVWLASEASQELTDKFMFDKKETHW